MKSTSWLLFSRLFLAGLSTAISGKSSSSKKRPFGGDEESSSFEDWASFSLGMLAQNLVPGTLANQMVEKAAKAGAIGMKLKGKKGKNQNNARTLMRAYPKTAWPSLYWCKTPMKNKKANTMVMVWHCFQLPHEWLGKYMASPGALQVCQPKNGSKCWASMQHICSQLGLPIAENAWPEQGLFPFGVHGDGVPVQSAIRKQGLDYFTVNLPCCPIDNFRVPFTAIQSKYHWEYKTKEAIWNVFMWSMDCLKRGQYPRCRHDGSKWIGPDNKRRGLKGALPGKGILAEVRGDWDWLNSWCNIPAYNTKSGLRWLCCATHANYTGFGPEERAAKLDKDIFVRVLEMRERPAPAMGLARDVQPLLHDTSPQYFATTLPHDTSPQHFATTHSPQHFPTTLCYNTSPQHFSTELPRSLHNTPSQHIPTTQRLQSTSTTLLYNTFPQHFPTTLCYNTSPKHFPPQHFPTTLLYNTCLQDFSATFLHNTLLQHFSTTLGYNTWRHDFSTTLLSKTSLQAILHDTSPQHLSTPLLQNTLLQHFPPQRLSATLLHNTLLQHFSTTLGYNTWRRDFSTTLLSKTSLQPILHNTSPHHLATTLHHNTSPQHSFTTLPYNPFSTTHLHNTSLQPILHDTSPQHLATTHSPQHISTTLPYNTPSQHFSTTHSPQHFSTTLCYNTSLHNTSPQQFSTTLLYNLSTTLLHNTLLQHFTTTLPSSTPPHNTSLQHLSTRLLYNTSLQDISTTLLYNPFSTTLPYNPFARTLLHKILHHTTSFTTRPYNTSPQRFSKTFHHTKYYSDKTHSPQHVSKTLRHTKYYSDTMTSIQYYSVLQKYYSDRATSIQYYSVLESTSKTSISCETFHFAYFER